LHTTEAIPKAYANKCSGIRGACFAIDRALYMLLLRDVLQEQKIVYKKCVHRTERITGPMLGIRSPDRMINTPAMNGRKRPILLKKTPPFAGTPRLISHAQVGALSARTRYQVSFKFAVCRLTRKSRALPITDQSCGSKMSIEGLPGNTEHSALELLPGDRTEITAHS